MNPAASLLIMLMAQDLPPPLEEPPGVELSEPRAVELSEDLYEEDDGLGDDYADETPTLDEFRRELAPHGRWIDTPEYGLVWVPAGVRSGWRPYTHGEWVYTRHGWTFVSHDPWGRIPFHYGRWAYRARYGWCWIPGYEWGPAWVSWRYGGDYIAWAPLGPTHVHASYYSSPSLWIAVHNHHFRRPLHRRHFIPTARVRTVFHHTREHRVRHGPTIDYVKRVTRQPVRRVKVVRHRRPRIVAPANRRVYERSDDVRVVRKAKVKPVRKRPAKVERRRDRRRERHR